MAVQSDEPRDELRPASIQQADGRGVASTASSKLPIAVAATFTADPLQNSLEFWLRALNIPADITFAPYAQVMQELLDADSLLGHNQSGINILLIRLEDWLRPEHTATQSRAHLQGIANDFILALSALGARTSASTLVFFCSPASSLTADHRQAVSEIRSSLNRQVDSVPRTYCVGHAELMKLYPVTEYEDPQADRIGHVPYTSEYFAAVGTLLARRIAALSKPPYKVIAVDGDNTLWKGVCGEVGADGIELTPAHRRFQEMLVHQHDAGMLLCLCSKNNADDVEEVFRRRPEMPLREEHLVASRVNWESKASNLKALSEELGLALDSFIFIDDSPMECAEVQAACPAVLSLNFPVSHGDILHFIDHVWAFDHLGVTQDAKRRTAQYKENRARSTALKDAGDLDLDRFLASLQVQVSILPMEPGHLDRVAELVQRTNQFNFSGIRRRAGEIEALWKSGELNILVAHVSDRFGDYGLVGVVIFRCDTDVLELDSFLLSCRVLGRRVEYQIVRELGRIARQRRISEIVFRFRRTLRNAPAWRFLKKAFSQFQRGGAEDGSGPPEAEFVVPVQYAESLGQEATADDYVHGIGRAVIDPLAESPVSHDWIETAHRISRLTDIVQEVRRFAARGREPAHVEYVSPRTPTEVALAQIWSDVLNVNKVSVEANFFDHGGNSLLAVQVLARIESMLGLELSLFDFLQAPTIANVANRLADASTSYAPIQRHPSVDAAPLSPAQQRLWFIDQLDGERMAYHVPLSVRMTGALDQRALQAALDAIVERHEALRTTFVNGQTEAVQKIAPHAAFSLQVFDLRAHSSEVHESAVLHHSKEELETPFDLSKGPLIRGRLLHLSDDKHVLLITMHHIVSDGWSIGIFFQELGVLYGAYRDGRNVTLAPLPIQYADYAKWQRDWLAGAQLREQLSYWKEHLQGAPELLMLPTDRPRPMTRSYRGGNVCVSLDPDLTKELKDFSRCHGLTLAMTLHTALVILLSRLSGQDDIVVGMPVANRRRTELEALIGMFVNTLAVRIRLHDDPTMAQLIERVKQVMLNAYANQDVPFEKVVEALHPTRALSHQPIFQVMLAMENTPRGSMQLSGLNFVEERVPQQTAQFDLLLSLEESGDRVVGTLNYACDLLDRATVERWAGYLDSVLRGMVRRTSLSVGKLPMLDMDERSRLIEFFNTPDARYPQTLIHELFEAQVHRAPSAVAVTFGDQALTYAELNQRANQLAHYLRDRHVGPDTLVGLYVERGMEMVIGILGILKAGGAYVAMDPQYPAERLQYMLNDAKPAVLLTQQHMMSHLPDTAAEVVQLDRDWKDIEQRPTHNLDARALGLRPGNVAYVIYTSGSTGQPKGVMVEHRNLTRLFAATDEWFRFGEHDVWTLFHSVAFDFSVWELWGALLYGGRVLVVSYMTARSPREFFRLLCEQGVTVLNQTPSSFGQLIEAQAQDHEMRHNLRVVIFGGEALELYKLRPWVERNGIRRTQLVNMYGITETTVHVTYQPLSEEEIRSETASPIGKPIPDLQLYLLDAHREPVPIGVVGEIYVGGAGVARGYLNRPELTAERFIADPFGKTPHSKLYKSGDLGRRRPDGTVEYLGRNDHQVKIRGFRIELGEIEAQLARHEQVRGAVVLPREHVHGEKRLVAYVVLRDPVYVDASSIADILRAHLKSLLPEYMLPSAFVVLPSFPLTSNGKLDRKALPVPEIGAYVRGQYEAPLGQVENGLAEIWQQLLQVEKIGRRDNFFELGGHSLLVISLLSRIQCSFGTMLKVADVYKSPTLHELCLRICGVSAADDLVNLSEEARLSDEIRPIRGPICTPPRDVLLTGATGFIGRFLLVQLLQYPYATVYCLVRASSHQQAALRIKNVLRKWDLWKEEFERRIVAIPGDLNSARLGLDETSYRVLAEKVESIYHCATSMNHLETYPMAKPVNVNASSELLKLATQINRKVINYISTLSVFSSDGTNMPRVVMEETLIDQEQHPASHGYAASKWVAEKIFMMARQRGIPCNVFRLGLVWADTQKGRYDDLQREYRILKSCLLSGYGIKNYRYAMPPTPVDYVARAVVFLANRYPDGQGIFHLSSSKQRVTGVFECSNKISGTGLQMKSVSEWIAALKRLHRNGVSLPVMPLIESAFDIEETEVMGAQISIGPSHSHVDCSKTHRELERGGIFAPAFDEHLVRLCIEDMLSRDEELRQAIGTDGKRLREQLRSSAGWLSSS